MPAETTRRSAPASRLAEQLQAVRADLPRDPFAEHPFFLTATVEGR